MKAAVGADSSSNLHGSGCPADTSAPELMCEQGGHHDGLLKTGSGMERMGGRDDARLAGVAGPGGLGSGSC